MAANILERLMADVNQQAWNTGCFSPGSSLVVLHVANNAVAWVAVFVVVPNACG